jgi:hypothetical protein
MPKLSGDGSLVAEVARVNPMRCPESPFCFLSHSSEVPVAGRQRTNCGHAAAIRSL